MNTFLNGLTFVFKHEPTDQKRCERRKVNTVEPLVLRQLRLEKFTNFRGHGIVAEVFTHTNFLI